MVVISSWDAEGREEGCGKHLINLFIYFFLSEQGFMNYKLILKLIYRKTCVNCEENSSTMHENSFVRFPKVYYLLKPLYFFQFAPAD